MVMFCGLPGLDIFVFDYYSPVLVFPNIMKSSELVILVHPILRGKEERDGKKKEKVEGKSNRYNK